MQQSVGPGQEQLRYLTLGSHGQESQAFSLHPQHVGGMQATVLDRLSPLHRYPELGSFPGGAAQGVLQHLQGRKLRWVIGRFQSPAAFPKGVLAQRLQPGCTGRHINSQQVLVLCSVQAEGSGAGLREALHGHGDQTHTLRQMDHLAVQAARAPSATPRARPLMVKELEPRYAMGTGRVEHGPGLPPPLGPKVLTLRKERPFCHSSVHGPQRLLPPFSLLSSD